MNYPGHQDNHPGSPELSEPQHPTARTSSTSVLDDRYGRTPSRVRRTKALAIAAAVAVVVVFAVWVVWAGPAQTDHGLDTDEVGYEIVSDHRAVVHAHVSIDPGTTAKCAVQVLDKSYTIVGWKEITVPAAEQRSRTVTTEVDTTTRGVTGLIHSCWVP